LLLNGFGAVHFSVFGVHGWRKMPEFKWARCCHLIWDQDNHLIYLSEAQVEVLVLHNKSSLSSLA